MLDALDHSLRRRLLRELLIHNPQDAESIGATPNELAGEELGWLIEMPYVHLPKLERYGFIVWDRGTKEVS